MTQWKVDVVPELEKCPYCGQVNFHPHRVSIVFLTSSIHWNDEVKGLLYVDDPPQFTDHTGVCFLACGNCHKNLGEYNEQKVRDYLKALDAWGFLSVPRPGAALHRYTPGSLLSEV